MIFRKTVGYALQTVIYLSKFSKELPAQQKDISESLNIPFHYLGKILQPLSKNKIIASKTGGKGGFYLLKSPDEIVLSEIVTIFEGPDYFETCIIGFPGCNDATPCPLHNDWKPSKIIIQNILNNHTVAFWAEELDSKLDFIKNL
jgi:Rrf2 family protein